MTHPDPPAIIRPRGDVNVPNQQTLSQSRLAVSAEPWELLLYPSIFRLLCACREIVPGEVSGLGVVEDVSPPASGRPHQFSVIYAEALSSGDSEARTEITPLQRLSFYDRIKALGYEVHQVKLWWHRHPVTGWSSTDYQTRRERVSLGAPGTWMLSLVDTPQGVLAVYDQHQPDRVVPLTVRVDWGESGLERSLLARYGSRTTTREPWPEGETLTLATLQKLYGEGSFECWGYGGEVTVKECAECPWRGDCFGGILCQL